VVEPAEGPVRVEIVTGSQPSSSDQSRTNPSFDSVRRFQRNADDKLNVDCYEDEPGFRRAPSRNSIGGNDIPRTIHVSQHIVISTDPDPRMESPVSGGYSVPDPLPIAVLPTTGGRTSWSSNQHCISEPGQESRISRAY